MEIPLEIPVSLDFRDIQESEKFGIKIQELSQKISTLALEYVKFILSKVISAELWRQKLLAKLYVMRKKD